MCAKKVQRPNSGVSHAMHSVGRSPNKLTSTGRCSTCPKSTDRLISSRRSTHTLSTSGLTPITLDDVSRCDSGLDGVRSQHFLEIPGDEVESGLVLLREGRSSTGASYS